MELCCPKCNKPIAYRQKDFAQGAHHEHSCPNCEEFLQWDQWPSQTALNAFGPPQACTHEPSRRTRPSGSVPYYK
jgi:uncharacterized protein YbaR (Trm112 family)